MRETYTMSIVCKNRLLIHKKITLGDVRKKKKALKMFMMEILAANLKKRLLIHSTDVLFLEKLH